VTSHDETESNRSTMTAAFHGWRDSGLPIADTFASEMTWRIVGHSAASRSYADKAAFVGEVLVPFGRRFSTTDPFRPVRIDGVYADGDTVIVRRRRIRTRSPSGRSRATDSDLGQVAAPAGHVALVDPCGEGGLGGRRRGR
jgi:hypothetical protein